ncbi:DUF916 and DUF3324 domain-containing protein [Halobacillus yeomjeoni]|uniref:WxL protein peptidoglycan domain-containing protein n=1 Tax=Halobacillus yeomjeoni TaxID=311194 RepID=UPI001CD80801|nr:DUF916 domain-containing protein [Halobacillus yeomjeoni]MCA0984252.1 DUF916 and DUF3324 domain-containing protein [Halobacillus yeomjeoni]
MKFKRTSTLIAMLFICFFLPSNFKAYANEKPPIYVEPVYPQNQNKEVEGYFDLSVQPGDSQQLKFRVENNWETSIEVMVMPANAYTHPSGGIVYLDNMNPEESSINDPEFHMADNIETPESVIIPPKDTVEIPVTLKVPELNKGELVGGVRFVVDGGTNKAEHNIAEEKTAQFQIKTLMATEIGIKLSLPEKAEPSYRFGKAGFVGKSTHAYIELINGAPLIQERIDATYEVTDQEGRTLFSGSIDSVKMAPKTTIQYPIPWTAETIEDGTYTLHITSTNENERVSIKRDITIQREELMDYQEQTAQPGNPDVRMKGITLSVKEMIALVFGVIALGITGTLISLKLLRKRKRHAN